MGFSFGVVSAAGGHLCEMYFQRGVVRQQGRGAVQIVLPEERIVLGHQNEAVVHQSPSVAGIFVDDVRPQGFLRQPGFIALPRHPGEERKKRQCRDRGGEAQLRADSRQLGIRIHKLGTRRRWRPERGP